MENTQNAIQVELSLQILSSDVHSMSAAIVPSAAWRLVWALGTMKNENETVLVDGLCQNGAKALNVVDLDIGYSGEGSKTIVPASGKCRIEVVPMDNLSAQEAVEKIREHLDSYGFADIQVKLC